MTGRRTTRRRTTRALGPAWLALALVAGGARTSFAQDDLGREAARDLYGRGLACFDRGDHECAIEAWSAALRELGDERGYRIHYNLGLAQEAAGRTHLAIDHYDRFLGAVAREEGALPPSLEERRQDAAERRRKLEATRAPEPKPPVPPPPAPTASPPIPTAAPPAPGPPPPAAHAEGATFPTAVVLIGVGLTGASLALPLVLRGEATSRGDEARALGAGHTGYPEAVEAFESARTAHDVSWILPVALATATVTVAVVGLVLVVGEDGEEARLGAGPGGAHLVGSF